jgi:hypothetical protein
MLLSPGLNGSFVFLAPDPRPRKAPSRPEGNAISLILPRCPLLPSLISNGIPLPEKILKNSDLVHRYSWKNKRR